jgi:crossover junction endodeoxyribonuclease RuvC
MIVIGIDPGLTGALACVSSTGEVRVIDLPVNEKTGFVKKQIDCTALRDIILINFRINKLFAVVEAVHAMPTQGVSTVFSLGDTLGVIRSVLACLNIETIFVPPATWKKAMGVSKDKKQSIELAKQLHPNASKFLTRLKDHNRAEAILLAQYYYNVLTGVIHAR